MAGLSVSRQQEMSAAEKLPPHGVESLMSTDGAPRLAQGADRGRSSITRLHEERTGIPACVQAFF